MKILILSLAVLLGHISRAAETLEEERKVFTGQLEKIAANAKDQKEKLGLQMITALGKSREAAKKAGNLDLVKAIDGETERWVSEGDLPLVPSQVPEITKLHEVYAKTCTEQKHREQRATLTAYDGYEKQLGQLEKSLVAQDKIKEAEAVRSERETTGESLAIKDAREAVAKANSLDPQNNAASGSKEREWKNLKDHKKFKAAGNKYFTSAFKEWAEKPEQSVTAGKQDYKGSEILYAHATGSIEFKFDVSISEFRGFACLEDRSGRGNIVFRIETESGEVFKSKEIKPGNRKEDINLKFEPTRKLVLIVDQNGENYEDWSFWAKPEYR